MQPRISVVLVVDGREHTVRVDPDITPRELKLAAAEKFDTNFDDFELTLVDSFAISDGVRIELRPKRASRKVDWED